MDRPLLRGYHSRLLGPRFKGVTRQDPVPDCKQEELMTPFLLEGQHRQDLNRRGFLQTTSLASLGLVLSGRNPLPVDAAATQPSGGAAGIKTGREGDLPSGGHPIKLFCCDLNWVRLDNPVRGTPPAAPQDWAFVNPQQYFDWHREFGGNVMFCQAYTFGGYAFYPTKLGPVAPGPGASLFPELFKLSRKAHLPFHSYFCVGADLIMSNMRNAWVVPTSRNYGWWGFLAPESPWTDLLCARVEEFLRLYPVEWIVFDWFVYGNLESNNLPVQPAWFVKGPFREIIGRDMPDEAAKITPEESLRYKREVLARQFYRIREAVHRGNRETKVYFNVPYRKPAEELWVNHPMLNESDMLLAESSDTVVPWLLSIRKPHQRVMTTIVGRQDGVSDPNTWKRWFSAGCDFFGYAWGTPPDFRPHPDYAAAVEVVRKAYQEMP